MSEANAIQAALAGFALSAGAVKRSGAWYRRGDDVVTVLELQKSQYGPKYYLNIGLWLLSLGDVPYPKPVQCHAQTRLEVQVPQVLRPELEKLMDLEAPIDDEDRRSQLQMLFSEHLSPILDVSRRVATLRSDGAGFLKPAAIRGPAVPLLRD